MKPNLRGVGASTAWKLLCSCLITPLALAEIYAINPLPTLLLQAEAVVIDTATLLRVAVKTVDVRLEIEEPLRGSLRAGSTIDLTWSRDRLNERASARPRGLFFLRRSPDWKVLPLLSGPSPLFTDACYFIPDGALPPDYRASASLPLVDRIFVLLEWAESRKVLKLSRTGGPMVLERDFPAPSQSPFIRERIRLRGVNPPPERQAESLRRSLGEGDLGQLRGLAAEHRRFQSNAAEWRAITQALAYEFPGPPGSAATLGQLANDTDRKLRTAAVTALARIHSREMLPVLARLMDDRDPEIQALGVGGLAMFANNVPAGATQPGPDPAPYRTPATLSHSTMSAAVIARDPAKYLGFWRQWWRENQASLSAPR